MSPGGSTSREAEIPQLEVDFEALAALVRQLGADERRRLRDLLDAGDPGEPEAGPVPTAANEAELAQLMDPSWAGLEEDWSADELVAAAADSFDSMPAPEPAPAPANAAEPRSRPQASGSARAPVLPPPVSGPAPDLDDLVDGFRGPDEAPAVDREVQPASSRASPAAPSRDPFSADELGLDFGAMDGAPVDRPALAEAEPEAEAAPDPVARPPADFDPFADLQAEVARPDSTPPRPDSALPPPPVSAPPVKADEIDPFADLLGDPLPPAVPQAPLAAPMRGGGKVSGSPPAPLSVPTAYLPDPTPEPEIPAEPSADLDPNEWTGAELAAPPEPQGPGPGPEEVEALPPPEPEPGPEEVAALVPSEPEPEPEPVAAPAAPLRRGDAMLGALVRAPSKGRPRADDEENVRTSIFVPGRDSPEHEEEESFPGEPAPPPPPQAEPAAAHADPLLDLFAEPEPPPAADASPAAPTWEKRFRGLFTEVRSQAAPSGPEGLLQELRKAIQEVRGS